MYSIFIDMYIFYYRRKKVTRIRNFTRSMFILHVYMYIYIFIHKNYNEYVYLFFLLFVSDV